MAAARPTLQASLDAALRTPGPSPGELEELLVRLAEACECTALIAVWDRAKARKLAPSEAVWAAVGRLHDLGKKRIPAGNLVVPAPKGKALQPARRLHKILKGRRLSQRSESASQALGPAVAWVKAERERGREFGGVKSARERINLAKELRTALGLTGLEQGRGLVTKLKQKKLLA